MLSHVRLERFLVITLPAVENKRSGAAEVAGIASTRLANTPNREFTAAAAEAMTKKSLTISIESLTSVHASEFLTSSITAMTIPRRSAKP